MQKVEWSRGREERTCGECDLGQVVDVQHSLHVRDEKTNGQTFFSPVKGITGF